MQQYEINITPPGNSKNNNGAWQFYFDPENTSPKIMYFQLQLPRPQNHGLLWSRGEGSRGAVLSPALLPAMSQNPQVPSFLFFSFSSVDPEIWCPIRRLLFTFVLWGTHLPRQYFSPFVWKADLAKVRVRLLLLEDSREGTSWYVCQKKFRWWRRHCCCRPQKTMQGSGVLAQLSLEANVCQLKNKRRLQRLMIFLTGQI